MRYVLCITIRFLDPVPQFHGRGNNGDPEWPPSPLRLFQALVSASANRWRENQFWDYARPAMQWLETTQPSIVSPQVSAESFGYRMYVPNNSGDLMTAAWARGDTETSMAKFRVEKDVRPKHLRADAIHYLYRLADNGGEYLETLRAAARCITHLGWGVDMVAGNAAIITEDEAAHLPGECWRPAEASAANGLRVPKEGTLAALTRKHEAFLNRLSADSFKPVPPLAANAYDIVGYRRSTDPPARRYAAFRLRHPIEDRAAPFAMTRANCVAAMTRNATARIADEQHQPGEWIDRYVHGHRQAERESLPRFSYLPLPSIEPREDRGVSVGSIRRILVAEIIDSAESHLLWARQMLPGQLLTDDKTSVRKAMLAPLTGADWVLQRYAEASDTWASVTPLILPGCDDGKFAKTEKLFFKALGHAGYSPEALAEEPEFRRVSFWPGVELAGRFQRPDYLRNCSAYHVRLRWRHALAGPLALGAGRHCGLGVFASL